MRNMLTRLLWRQLLRCHAAGNYEWVIPYFPYKIPYFLFLSPPGLYKKGWPVLCNTGVQY
jgi:hypothetical protein